jgi:hypothetical protein
MQNWKGADEDYIMDDYFACFIDDIGPEMHREEAPPSSIDKYRGVLPDQLLTHWAKYGWSGYGQGIFWCVNPAEYEAVISTWISDSGIPDADTYYVIARGAFGDFYLWQQTSGSWFTLSALCARYMQSTREISPDRFDEEIEGFFVSMDREANDFDDLFEEALKKLGPLKPDEMYGFVPAIALGGPGTLNTLQKVKTIEHLTFLSQLSPLTDWGFPDLNEFDG